MVHAARQQELPALTNRGPSRDQPAPGSRRHIPFDAPEPGAEVTIVAVLEQSPAHERWERTPDGWLHAGYRGSVRPERMVVGWDKVGICGRGTKHDLKDVSDRAAEWLDRPTDGLPERVHEVVVDVLGDQAAVEQLLDACDDVTVTGGPGGRNRCRFRRAATTLPGAIAAVARDVERAGLDVVAVNATA